MSTPQNSKSVSKVVQKGRSRARVKAPQATDEKTCNYCKLPERGPKDTMVSCLCCDFLAHPSCFKKMNNIDLLQIKNVSLSCKTKCAWCNDVFQITNKIQMCPRCKSSYHLNCLDVIEAKTNGKSGKFKCPKCAEGGILEDQENIPFVTDTPRFYYVEDQRRHDAKIKLEPTLEQAYESTQLSKLPLKGTLALTIGQHQTSCFSHKRSSLKSVKEWSVDDVYDRLIDAGFVNEAEIFKRQEIDGRSLMLLQRNDILHNFEIKFGPGLKLFSYIRDLQSVTYKTQWIPSKKRRYNSDANESPPPVLLPMVGKNNCSSGNEKSSHEAKKFQLQSPS